VQVFLDIVESVNLLMSQKCELTEFSDIPVATVVDDIEFCRSRINQPSSLSISTGRPRGSC
jgi:hypothetical protein